MVDSMIFVTYYKLFYAYINLYSQLPVNLRLHCCTYKNHVRFMKRIILRGICFIEHDIYSGNILTTFFLIKQLPKAKQTDKTTNRTKQTETAKSKKENKQETNSAAGPSPSSVYPSSQPLTPPPKTRITR